MRTYFFPHALLAPKELYVAVMHANRQVSTRSLYQWIKYLDNQTIAFNHHKLISDLVEKFPSEISSSSHAGTLLNIHRQARLRAQINLNLLSDTFRKSSAAHLNLSAIGDLREHILSFNPHRRNCDFFELVAPSNLLPEIESYFSNAQWRVYTKQTFVRNRNISYITFQNQKFGTLLKIFGIDKFQTTEQVSFEAGHLKLMTDVAHKKFMQSRVMSLIHRRDQLLYDIYCNSQLETNMTQKFRVRNLPLYFQSTAYQIMGAY